MPNIFLFNNFLEKSSTSRENFEELFWGHIWRFIRESRRLAQKIKVTF